jgi:putative ABC transport system permease protein
MDTLWQDLRFGFRLLARSRAFFATAVIALALGIGANTAVFSVVYSVLLKPLPFPAPDRLVMVHETMPGMAMVPDSFAEYAAWRDKNRVFSALGASTAGTAALTGHGDPERLMTARMTAPLFRVFGVRPALGRWFTEEEDRPNGPKAVVLSYPLWKKLGADPSIVGKTLTLDEVPRTVVGVMPENFTFRAASAFLPLTETATEAAAAVAVIVDVSVALSVTLSGSLAGWPLTDPPEIEASTSVAILFWVQTPEPARLKALMVARDCGTSVPAAAPPTATAAPTPAR